MKYALIFLLLLVGCKTQQVASVKPIELQAPDSLPDPLSANGWVFVRTSVEGGIYVPPVPPKKVKIKGSYNTKAKGEAIVGNDNQVQEAPRKIKADIVGDGNSQEKKGTSYWPFLWIAFLGVGLLVWLYKWWTNK